MEKNKTILECDVRGCDNKIEYRTSNYFGGHPAQGWMFMSIVDGNTSISATKVLQDNGGKYHICPDCAKGIMIGIRRRKEIR